MPSGAGPGGPDLCSMVGAKVSASSSGFAEEVFERKAPIAHAPRAMTPSAATAHFDGPPLRVRGCGWGLTDFEGFLLGRDMI